jgi:Mg2+ and Co2+ transporter CorA
MDAKINVIQITLGGEKIVANDELKSSAFELYKKIKAAKPTNFKKNSYDLTKEIINSIRNEDFESIEGLFENFIKVRTKEIEEDLCCLREIARLREDNIKIRELLGNKHYCELWELK